MAIEDKDKLREIQKLVAELLDDNTVTPAKGWIKSGPDAKGRVKLVGAKDVYVLTHLTIKELGKAALNKEQLATICQNVGCDENGELVGAGPGEIFFRDMRSFVYNVEPITNFWISSYRLNMNSPIQPENGVITVAVRSLTPEALVARVNEIDLPFPKK